MKPTTIHGSRIVAALRSDLQRKGVLKSCTRVWCEDGSLHLVTGYETRGQLDPCFDTVIGYWEIPEGEMYLSPHCREIVTRPFIVAESL
jgi:hypothetical protein